jgi:Domain of unknown function (DUF4394)
MGSRIVLRIALLVGAVALLVPLVASAGDYKGYGKHALKSFRNNDAAKRTLYATDSVGNLLSFKATAPESARSKQITGLPSGISLKGIDFRPATGDLYALGSDKVVYRVNPLTAIAIAEGPAFETTPTALNGDRIGLDFNPTVDKIRLTSDADDNIRLDPDSGSLLATDSKLNPADVTVVGSAYTNSSFTATKPTATTLYAYDTSGLQDRIHVQNPPNTGTLTMPKGLGIDLGSDVGFDIAGDNNVGYVAGTPQGDSSARLYTVDVTTGKTRQLGRIGRRGVTITGLAAWQS